MTSPFASPDPPAEPKLDVEAYAIEAALRSLIMLGSVTAPRSLQVTLGTSEVGHVCERRIAYRLAGTPKANLTDPLRSLTGTGVHLALADMFRRLGAHSGRFLVEQPVCYRGVPGTVDLYDRYTRTVIDWKTVLKSKLSHLRHDGPARNYVTQTMLYAAGLREAGEDVKTVALAFLPVDDELAKLWVWRAPFDQARADEAMDRIEALRYRAPETVPATPDRLCGWCDYYRPQSTDLATGCPGPQK
jgi:hypothetical protein